MEEPILEFVLYDENNKEIDWIDPINYLTEDAAHSTVLVDNGFGGYEVFVPAGYTYEIRVKQ